MAHEVNQLFKVT